LNIGGSMKRLFAAAALVTGLAGSAMAADFQTIGTMGMGGAGVARDMGAYAPYWNPAGLAFATKPFSTTVGAGAGFRVSDGLADNVDRLSKFTDGNPSALDDLKSLNTGVANPQKLGEIVNLMTVLKDVSVQKGTLSLSLDASAGFQVKQFGFGFFMLREGFGRVLGDFDPATGNLRNILPVDTSGNAITAGNLVTLAGTPATSQTYFDSQQVARLSTALSGMGIRAPGQQTNVINGLGNSLSSPANTTIRPISSAQATDTFVNTLSPAINSAGASPTNNLGNNQTAIMEKNVLFTEIPISYGHAFDLGAYGKLGVGGSLKVVNGRVYQTRIRLTENGESVTSSDIVNGFRENFEQSTDVTFDLGTQWKYSKMLTVGLVAKNLTSPAFKSPELKDQKGRLVDSNGNIGVRFREGDVKLKPQVRLGLAVAPLPWLSLASDIDLTENQSILSGADFKNRHFGGGVELSPFDWAKFRGGIYDNLASSGIGPVATAGLTLGISPVLFEVDGAYGFRTSRYNETSYPRESRLQAQFVVQF